MTPLPTSVKKQWRVFLRILLGLALLSQQTEAEKDLPLGGAVVILHFKSLLSSLWTANLTRHHHSAHQVLPTRQKLSASAHRRLTEQARRTNSMFYKTEVRLLDIKRVFHLCSSLGQSKFASEAILSEASAEKYLFCIGVSYQPP